MKKKQIEMQKQREKEDKNNNNNHCKYYKIGATFKFVVI